MEREYTYTEFQGIKRKYALTPPQNFIFMKRKTVVQNHHITYKPEWKVKVYKGEHWILTQLARRKKISKGFLTALGYYIYNAKGYAKELE